MSTETKPTKYKLAKGKQLVIPGIGYPITDENVNKPATIAKISRDETVRGVRHFGVTIVKA